MSRCPRVAIRRSIFSGGRSPVERLNTLTVGGASSRYRVLSVTRTVVSRCDFWLANQTEVIVNRRFRSPRNPTHPVSMKRILLALLLLLSLFLFVFASLRAVPAKAQSGSTALGTRPTLYGGVAPNTTGNNSGDEDEDCMCNA